VGLCNPVSFSYIYTMGWLRLVGSLKIQVSFAKEPYKRDDILQKRLIISRSLLIVATPYAYTYMYVCEASVYVMRMTHPHVRPYAYCIYMRTHCRTLQHTATYHIYVRTHSNTLQHAATRRNTQEPSTCTSRCIHMRIRCNTLQLSGTYHVYMKTHCNTLQHTATRMTHPHIRPYAYSRYSTLYIYGNTLQHTATH